ncbi:MAG: hypothetical protein JWN21_1917 [Sphingomonas bacterium]|uniref:rhomboid family intramembrane serine protease n=1 Tax=Sphingomonas bacterium TaxID=1895847 RepID=UPI002617E06A|nr:rhomboid family intramembrane serine protease [Sphingomonas bacterium]MDB5696374.1 hypothetical protein [Sphingomonas bacterium]
MTDALVALTVFGGLMMLIPSVFAASKEFVYSPAGFLAAVGGDPLVALVSPLVSHLAQIGIFSAAFTAIFLLIAGRFLERAVGGMGIMVLMVAGLYGGALARLLLTPASVTPGFSPSGGLFAIIGAYLMLYGVPRGLPVKANGGRAVQIATIAAIWAALQLVFAVVAGGVDFSVQIIEPLGGLVVGAALARPVLAWRYRRA